MGNSKKPPSESSSSGSYSSDDDYSDSSSGSGSVVSSSISNVSKSSSVSKKSKHKKQSSVISNSYSNAKSRAKSSTTKVSTTVSPTTEISSIPSSTNVVPLSEAAPSVFDVNVKKNKPASEVASTVATSALPVQEAPKTSSMDIAEGGGWSIWNAIINQKQAEKNSVPGIAKRTFSVIKESYIAILAGMLVVFITLVTLRPSFVLGDNISRYEDPPLDLMRVGIFTFIFGGISFGAVQSISK